MLFKTSPRLRRFLYTAFAFCLAGFAAARAGAQGQSAFDRMMELNRSGQWDEAARLAGEFLAAAAAKPRAEVCQARWSLAYSQARLAREADALASLAAYDRDCKGLPASANWLDREVARLRAELRPHTAPPVRDDGFWRSAEPRMVGVRPDALAEHRELCMRSAADACLVIRKGRIVQEFYSPRYRTPMMAMSSTKSVTGLLVGMLFDDGRIKSIDDPVCKYVPEWCSGRRGKVTIRHLLSMTSGLPRMFEDGVGYASDKNAFVVGLEPSAEPGTAWAYSNEGVQLLSPLLDKAAGEPIQDYARRRLFGPLGMRETRLHLDPKGHAWTYADMETTARDFARLGLLMLGGGVWEGKRIVSRDWVEQSTKPSQTFAPYYGLLWWLVESPRGYAAVGNLDTNLYVFPEEELVVVRMQSKPKEGAASYSREAPTLFRKLVERADAR